ncbi:N-acetyl-gamma-glutamyl-phosphate reductase, partial [Candidatus Sumerlaeota bacterium]|nr:N-acetyl-gamma-glutamyl-phosphate reductase [Candidatus Sumerlaeota bacterium]
NFCDIGLTVDTHSNVLIVVSATDNLAKGAASQGVQGMNILYGLPETTGLLAK